MAVSFLDFEQPIAELEAKIEELRHVTSDSEVNIQDEIARLQAKSRQLTSSIFANLTPWQITQLLDLRFELGDRLFEIEE